MNTSNLKKEIYRKIFHLTSIWIPIVIGLLSKTHAVMLIGFCLICMLFYEKLKDESPDFMNGLKKVLGWLINFKKSKTLSSTTYVLTASFLAILFFDKEIAITSISIMILSDSVASIVGRSFGKRIVYDKTMEGSAAFLVTSIVISMFLFFSMYDTQKFIISSLAGSIVATIAELIASKIDVNDNILVTLSTAVTMQFMFVIL
ncbi:MAG: diacylglycerol/polyprenol kinase family protein [Alphaproteobacteria bacterium]|jgi:dolichol kinase|nr:hypothetical protein [Candidatus Jidaibacter sp.]